MVNILFILEIRFVNAMKAKNLIILFGKDRTMATATKS